MNLFASFNNLYNPTALQAQVKQLQTPLFTPPKIDGKAMTQAQAARGQDLTSTAARASANLNARFTPATASVNPAPPSVNGYTVPANYQSFLDTGYL